MQALIDAVNSNLAGELGIDEFLETIQNGQRELKAHQIDISSMLQGVPDFLMAEERDSWHRAYAEFEEALKIDKIADPGYAKRLSDCLPVLTEKLAITAVALREAAWAARGPSSHPGANELLYLVDSHLDDPSEESEELILRKLEVEAARFEHQAQNYQDLPDFVAVAMEQLLPEYRDILESLSCLQELNEEQTEELNQELEEWAQNYSLFDIEFLLKRYSQMPTVIPSVNFALNCQMLYLDELLNDDMVDYALNTAEETLNRGVDQFLSEVTVSAVAGHSLREARDAILSELEKLVDVSEKEDLQTIGTRIVELSQNLADTQSRAENEGGSRLDFKSEAP